jgi:hypothetical protein
MATKNAPVVFCDIGDILDSPVFSPPPRHLERLDVFPFVASVLNSLREIGNRLGVISNTGEETADSINNVLEKGGLLPLFEKNLLIYSSVVGLTKNSPEIFKLAAEKAGLAEQPNQCLFVGEDPRERSFAAQTGFLVARDLSLLGNVFPPPTFVSRPDISNMAACIEDCQLAALDSDPGPEDPTDFHSLLERLEASRAKMPLLYRETVVNPFISRLQAIGPSGFNRILLRDSARESTAGRRRQPGDSGSSCAHRLHA